MDLTAERLREVLSYSPETGEFRWRVTMGARAQAGSVTGCPSVKGYVVIRVDKKLYTAHRLAWLHVYGRWPADKIDHQNKDGRDNRLCNLRECSQAENTRNKRICKNNKAGAKGVFARGNRYAVVIRSEGRTYWVGTFDTIVQASSAYDDAAIKYHRSFAGINGV